MLNQAGPMSISYFLRTVLTVLTVLVVFSLAGCGDESIVSSTGSRKADLGLSPALVGRDSLIPVMRVISPEDGAVVTSPFRVVVETEHFELAPKGRVRDGEGHFHVIIDHSCEPPSAQIPDDDLHLHVGSGAAETMVELEPGEHSLCVQLGDGFHTALKTFDTINITVEP